MMKFNSFIIFVFLSFSSLAQELTFGSQRISEKKFKLINEARLLSIPLKIKIFKDSNYDKVKYQKKIDQIINSTKKLVLKKLVYSKAIQRASKRRGLKVFNKTKNESYLELQKLESRLLAPYLKSGNGFYHASLQLVTDLQKAKYPFLSEDLDQRYKEIKDFWEQEEIERYRDEETKKAEYLLFHPKAKTIYFPSLADMDAQRERLKEIIKKSVNGKVTLKKILINKDYENFFKYFSPSLKSAYFLSRREVVKEDVLKTLTQLESLFVTITRYKTSIKKARLALLDSKEDLSETEKIIKSFYEFALNNRVLINLYLKNLKNVKQNYLDRDVSLSSIFSKHYPDKSISRLMKNTASFLEKSLDQYYVVEVNPKDIYSSDVYLKIEQHVNMEEFKKNKKDFLSSEIFRHLNFFHARKNHRVIDLRKLFIK